LLVPLSLVLVSGGLCMSLFKFIKSRYFWIHLGLMFGVGIILLWLSLKFLDLYTSHGQQIKVPDFKGLSIGDLEKFADDHDLRCIIIDSVFDLSLKKGIVVMQDPAAGTKVKDNRMVYLTVVAQKPERTSMPELLDLTLRQATAMLESYGLKIGNL
jgi:eukaryotic-like serine/threonine-protein kinase